MALWTELDRAITASGDEIILRRRDNIYEIRFNGLQLMSNTNYQSEIDLASYALREVAGRKIRVLVGGLGMGFTLRAALDRLDAASHITVSELIPEIVIWNEGPLGSLAGYPLNDPRIDLKVCDVMQILNTHDAIFDVILLDTDNGPDFTVRHVNGRLYASSGLAAVYRSLRPGGVAAFWSATISDQFETVLREDGWRWWREDVQLSGERVDASHHIYFINKDDTSPNIGLPPKMPESDLLRG